MNKRINNKVIKKNNTKKMNFALNELSKSFKIKDKTFINSNNDICNFNIREIDNWLFSIWISDNGMEYIGEHIDLIDKFKPSRTYVSEKELDTFISKLKSIKDKPKYHLVNSLTYGEAEFPFKQDAEDENWFDGYQVVREYNSKTNCWDIITRDESITQDIFVEKKYNEYLKEKEEEKENILFDKKFAFNFFENELFNEFEDIMAVGVIDRNTINVSISPRYDLLIVLNRSLTNIQLDELFEKINAYIIDYNFSKKRKTYEHQFDLFALYDDLRDIEKCHYKYYCNN